MRPAELVTNTRPSTIVGWPNSVPFAYPYAHFNLSFDTSLSRIAGSGWYRVLSSPRPQPFHCAEPKATGPAGLGHALSAKATFAAPPSSSAATAVNVA